MLDELKLGLKALLVVGGAAIVLVSVMVSSYIIGIAVAGFVVYNVLKKHKDISSR